MITKILFVLVAVIFVASFTPAYAQHHSGAMAPPIDFGGMQVALSTLLSPDDFTMEDAKNAILSIRFFDSETDTNINSVTYRVQIFQGESLVANEYFYDDEGKLDLEIRPTLGCQNEDLWKCTKYFGEKHAIAGGYYARGDNLPIIQGPVFAEGGDYKVRVSIVGATNPRTSTATDLHFETFLVIPEKHNFMIQTASAQEFPVTVKSFDGEVSGFSYDDSAKKISYEIPFGVHHTEHDSELKQSIHLKKNFGTFKSGYDIDVFLNGEKLQGGFVVFDSAPIDENVIRLSIPHEMIQNSKDMMRLEILPGDEIQLKHLDFSFDNGYSAKVSWNAAYSAGVKIPFSFSFYDNKGNPAKDVLFAYSMIDNSGKEFWSNIGTSQSYLGILSPSGTSQESVLIPTQGDYEIKLILTGENGKNFESFFSAQSDFSIGSSPAPQVKKSSSVPAWVKNNAGWWADGTIADSEFLSAIKHLIKEEIIIVSQTQGNTAGTDEIPQWIKNNAEWWAQGQIEDESFLQGIQFMIKEGILRI